MIQIISNYHLELPLPNRRPIQIPLKQFLIKQNNKYLKRDSESFFATGKNLVLTLMESCFLYDLKWCIQEILAADLNKKPEIFDKKISDISDIGHEKYSHQIKTTGFLILHTANELEILNVAPSQITVAIQILNNNIVKQNGYKDWIKLSMIIKKKEGNQNKTPQEQLAENEYMKYFDTNYYRCLTTQYQTEQLQTNIADQNTNLLDFSNITLGGLEEKGSLNNVEQNITNDLRVKIVEANSYISELIAKNRELESLIEYLLNNKYINEQNLKKKEVLKKTDNFFENITGFFFCQKKAKDYIKIDNKICKNENTKNNDLDSIKKSEELEKNFIEMYEQFDLEKSRLEKKFKKTHENSYRNYLQTIDTIKNNFDSEIQKLQNQLKDAKNKSPTKEISEKQPSVNNIPLTKNTLIRNILNKSKPTSNKKTPQTKPIKNISNESPINLQLIKDYGKIHSEPIRCLAVCETNDLLQTCCDDGTIKQFKISSHELVHNYQRVHQDKIMAIKIISEKAMILAITVSFDVSMKVIDVVNKKIRFSFRNIHSDKIWSLDVLDFSVIKGIIKNNGKNSESFKNDKSFIAFTGGRDQTLVQYDIMNNKVQNNYGIIHEDTITCICTVKNECEKFVLTASRKSLKFWKLVQNNADTNTTKIPYLILEKEFEDAHSNFIRAITITPCGNYAFTAGEDKILKKWDIYQKIQCTDYSTNENIYSDEIELINDISFQSNEEIGDIFTTEVSPCGNFVFTGGSDTNQSQQHVSNNSHKQIYKAIHENWILCIKFTFYSSFLFTCSKDQKLKQWQI